MDKAIWKLTGEWSYFLGNVLLGVRVAFLPYCPLVLSLLKHRGVGHFWTKKMKNPNRESLLNSSTNDSLIRENIKHISNWPNKRKENVEYPHPMRMCTVLKVTHWCYECYILSYKMMHDGGN